MRKKDLIIKLIEQDLRHNYLLKGLQKIGLQTEDHREHAGGVGGWLVDSGCAMRHGEVLRIL